MDQTLSGKLLQLYQQWLSSTQISQRHRNTQTCLISNSRLKSLAVLKSFSSSICTSTMCTVLCVISSRLEEVYINRVTSELCERARSNVKVKERAAIVHRLPEWSNPSAFSFLCFSYMWLLFQLVIWERTVIQMMVEKIK